MTDTNRFINTDYLTAPDAAAAPIPNPGRYTLQFGNVTAKFVDAKRGENDRGAWEIPANIEVQPNLTIVADANGDTTFAEAKLNAFYRLDTLPVKGKGGALRNWSTLSAALELMGLQMPRSGDPDEIIGAAQALSGQVTPVPVFVTYNGARGYKNFYTNADGARVYLDESLYRLGDSDFVALAREAGVAPEQLAEDTARFRALKLEDYAAQGGTWTKLGYLLGGTEWTLQNPGQNADAEKVWANMEPTKFSWRPRK